MGIFKRTREKREIRKRNEVLTNTFKLLQGYNPIYTSYDGGLYEMALTRTCIDKIANQCSKLTPIINANKIIKE